MITWHKRATGVYSAHAFVNGETLCGIKLRAGGEPSSWGSTVTELVDAPLSAHGQPFGPTCARCLKLARTFKQSA